MITSIGTDYYKGQAQKVYLLCGMAAKDGEIRQTQSGRSVSSVSVKAKEAEDGQAMWVSVTGWGDDASAVARIRKGDTVFAVGKLRERDYNGKTYYDFAPDYLAPKAPMPSRPAGAPVSVTPPGDDFVEVGDNEVLPF